VPKTVASLVVLALSSAGFGQERSDIPAFPTRADAIIADVVVLGKDDRPVRGLTREDFTLLEDGLPQALVAFEARELRAEATEPVPKVGDERVATNEGGVSRGRTFAFLLDDLGTQPLPMEDVKRSVNRWLQEKADPRDEVTLATVSGDVWWSDRIDRGRSDLEVVLGRVRGKRLPDRTKEWISDWEAYRITVFEDATGAAAASMGPPPGGAGPPGPGPALGASPMVARVAGRTDLRIGEIRMRAMEVYSRLNTRMRSVLSATERLSRGLAGTRGRKTILVFSEGFLYDSNQAQMFDRAVDASQRANTAIYFIDAKGLAGQYSFGADQRRAPDPRDLTAIDMEENVFETAGTEHVAENTGGASVRNTNDLFGGLARVAEESSTYYLLGYQPEKSPDGKWHKLEVKVSRPGLKVRTRHGYQATPSPVLEAPSRSAGKNKAKDAKVPKRTLDPAVMTSGASDALALRVAPYVLEADRTGLARVLVVVELQTSRLGLNRSGEHQIGAVDLTIFGMSRDDGKTFPLDERLRIDLDGKAAGGWMNLSRELRLPPGVAQVRVLVRDVASGLAGAVTQRLEIPNLDRPYLLTPIVTDRMITGGGKGPRLVPVAHRLFRPKGILFCSYEVVGMTNAAGEATMKVAGGFTLRRSDGRIVNQSAPTPIAVALGGKVIRLFALPLAGLEAGEYELVLDIVDEASGRTLQSHESFVVEVSAT
jgi:VWFA-related protein